MSPRPFQPSFESLPRRIPVFPLSGALLLPRCKLPLNIFEPRYIRMVEDALGTPTRLVGMVQPRQDRSDDPSPDICDVGCAGRISSFAETDDGRFLVILTGVSRFRVRAELVPETAYRQVAPDWAPFEEDLEEPVVSVDRERLYASMRAYFDARDLDTDWEALEEATDEHLVNSLAMSCPFEPEEKQVLLEADDVTERTQLMIGLMEMAALEGDEDPGARTH